MQEDKKRLRQFVIMQREERDRRRNTRDTEDANNNNVAMTVAAVVPTEDVSGLAKYRFIDFACFCEVKHAAVIKYEVAVILQR